MKPSPAVHRSTMRSDLDELIMNRRTLVCVGPGGVGKTTTSAAIGVRAATLGRKTLVLTIDPAHRLANALGLSSFEHEQQRIADALFADADLKNTAPLHAMMLDTRRTFDEVVRRYAGDPEVQARILESPFYEQASTRLAGSQEYMAMEKLYELAQTREFDLIVLDTPPTMHALDFLDAPDRLEAFMSQSTEGITAASTKLLSSLGLSFMKANAMILQGIGKFLGTQLFLDILAFLGDFRSMYIGFRERAQAVKAMMRSDDVGFLVLSSAEPSSVSEGLYFAEQLTNETMPVAGYILNRVRRQMSDQKAGMDEETARSLAQALAASGTTVDDTEELLRKLELCLRQANEIAARDVGQTVRVRKAVPVVPLLAVPDFEEDIHDLRGLYRYGQHLASVNGSGE